MLRYQEASANDPGRVQIRATKASSRAPSHVDPMALRWARRFERMLIAAETAADEYERGLRDSTHAKDTRSAEYRATNRRIVGKQYEECDPTWVAFMECRTTRNVTELRGRAGLDPQTGLRATNDNLTARP